MITVFFAIRPTSPRLAVPQGLSKSGDALVLDIAMVMPRMTHDRPIIEI
jgi:hypothetical protein